MLKVPLIKYPIRVLLVEDDPDFSHALCELMKDEASFKFETTPPIAKKLDSLGGVDQAVETLFYGDEPEAGVFTSEIHLNQFKRLKKTLDNLYPIIVSDYYLGPLDGLTLFENIQDGFVQKLLITNAADETLAIEAFNKGQIHGFLKKHLRDFDEHLKSEIIRNIDRFFLGLSEKIAGSSLRGMQSLLEEEDFKTFFDRYIADHKIQEFYAIDGMGSYLLVSKRGKEIFHISSQEELEDASEIYTSPIREKLSDFSHQIVRYEKGAFSRPLENAQKDLVKASKVLIKGKSYYYSVFPQSAGN
tara:strand:- start:129 stop:1034 length:906 start_codon:yes stop_codon:yes gene_type:complete